MTVRGAHWRTHNNLFLSGAMHRAAEEALNREGSWWAEVPAGASMTAAAESRRTRLRSTRFASMPVGVVDCDASMPRRRGRPKKGGQ